MGATSRKASIALAGGVAAALLLWCTAFVPSDMDEFAPVHRLACRYPLSYLHTFREGCDAYVLSFGAFSFHRTFAYEGITSSLLYFPLWSIWKSPFSFYLLGVIFLALFAFGLTKALQLEIKYALIPLCYFPIVYLLIHDTGPIRLAFLSLPVLALLARSAIGDARPPRQIVCGVLGALLVIACVEDKPFYLFVAPTILTCVAAVATMAYGADGLTLRAAARRVALALSTFVIVAAAGIGVLLFVGRTEGVTYFTFLRTAAGAPGPLFDQVRDLFLYTALPPMSGSRVFAGDHPLKLMSTLSLIPLAILIVWLWRARAVDALALAWMSAAFAAGVVIFLFTRVEWQPHHYVFLHLPILLLLMMAASRNTAGWNAVLTYVVVSTVLAMATLIWHAPDLPTQERHRVFAYLSRPDVAGSHLVNVSRWEGYYQQALYGPESQLVTYVDPLTERDGRRLVAVAESVSRNILNVCLECSRESMRSAFAGREVDEVELGLAWWKVFEVRPCHGTRCSD